MSHMQYMQFSGVTILTVTETSHLTNAAPTEVNKCLINIPTRSGFLLINIYHTIVVSNVHSMCLFIE